MRDNPPRFGRLQTLLLLALTCGLSPAAAWAAPVIFPASEAGSGSAVLELQVDELVTMTRIPFRLTIRDATGLAVTGAQVTCEMTMPAMAMPENRPQVIERGGGDYGGELVFTCAQGAWRINCLAVKADGSRQAVIFDIPRVRMR